MTLALFVDVIVCLLLGATIVYAALLNRRLSAFRSNRNEMESLIRAFSDACARAEAGTRSLRTATEEATRLQAYLERSQNLRDDLSYLLDRGGSLADRLEGGVRVARGETARANPLVSPNPDRAGERVARAPTEAPLPEAPVERGGGGDAGDRPNRERLRERMRTAMRDEAGDGVPDPAAEPRPSRRPDERRLERLGAERTERPERAERLTAATGGDRIADRMAERVAERMAQRATERAAGLSEGEEAPRPARGDRALLRAAMNGDAKAVADSTAPRSKAERELLQALRGRR